MNATTTRRNMFPVVVVLALVIFLAGGVVGVLYQKSGTSAPTSSTLSSTAGKLVTTVQSPVVSALIVYGTVKSISGTVVTVAHSGGTASVNVGSQAKVYVLDETQNQAVPKASTFASIKVGSTIQMNAKVLGTYALDAMTAVVIISAPAQ